MNIPIANIYWMLVYAWDVLEEGDPRQLRADECTTLVNLFARVLHFGTEALLRRGLDRGYIVHSDSIAGIRGKLDFSSSLKAATFHRGRAVCEFDELTHDVLHNRILKTTIRRLLSVNDLDSKIRAELAETHYRLHQIAEIDLSVKAFRSVQLYRNNRYYNLLMSVCKLLFQSRLTSEDAGESELLDFLREDRRMRRLFEKFVRNFFRREKPDGFQLVGNQLHWAGAQGNPEALAKLPAMRTDVRLRSSSRTIVIETKFVPKMFQEQFGKLSLRSGHLYQLFAYAVNLAASQQGSESLDSILLYPTVHGHYDFNYELCGLRLRVYTLDLNRDWNEIHADMIGLLRPVHETAQPTTPADLRFRGGHAG